MSKPIMLSEVLKIDNPSNYKVHFAKWNQIDQPLDVFTRSREEWRGWQEYRGSKDDFNRQYIFSLARYYHEHESSTWLFGGIFEVVGRKAKRYEVKLTATAESFIGRLKIFSTYNDRNVRVNMEKHYYSMAVSELLSEPFVGRAFPGFDDVDLSFEELEVLVKNDRTDWKTALENAKGIYLITDSRSGKKYVGAAYGKSGIWSRWKGYIATGHGGNIGLREFLTNIPTLDYCRRNFRFALLEHRPFRTPDEVILAREIFWKNILLSRKLGNLNRN